MINLAWLRPPDCPAKLMETSPSSMAQFIEQRGQLITKPQHFEIATPLHSVRLTRNNSLLTDFCAIRQTPTVNMATESALLAPPTNNSPEAALQLSQAAPSFFASQRSFTLPWPLSLLSATESQEKWQIYNNIFLACLQSGDNESAYLCLEEITDRFGKENERVMALQGLYEEATAKNDTELQAVLGRYEELLKEDPTLFAVQKRRAALLRSMGKTNEAVVALTYLLDASPIDAESWAEIADVYLTQGLYEQAIFSLEEVLLCTPNAWNIHARLGEVLFLAANKSEGAEQLKGLSEAMRRFCRSIELCDDYLRGYYGLKLVCPAIIPKDGCVIHLNANRIIVDEPPDSPAFELQVT